MRLEAAISLTRPILATGTSEGAKKAWDTRGRGRHSGSEYSLKPIAESNSKEPNYEYYSWAAHPQKGLVWDRTPMLKDPDAESNLENAQGEHANWFKRMGLPYYGEGFDDIRRGRLSVDHDRKMVLHMTYDQASGQEYGNDVRKAVEKADPRTKQYKWV